MDSQYILGVFDSEEPMLSAFRKMKDQEIEIEDFALSALRADSADDTFTPDGPEMLFCLEGKGEIKVGDYSKDFNAGDAF